MGRSLEGEPLRQAPVEWPEGESKERKLSDAQVIPEALDRAEREYQEFLASQGEDLARVEKTARDLGLPEETSELGKRFAGIRKEAQVLLRHLKRTLGLGLASATLLQGAEFARFPEVVKAAPSATLEEGITEKKRELPKVSPAHIREMLMRDELERVFISPKGKGLSYVELPESGTRMNVEGDFQKIEAFLRKEQNRISVGHTHHANIYRELGYSQDFSEKVKKREIIPPPLPPSGFDITAAASLQSYLEEKRKDVELKKQVFEPTGIWEFKLEKNHPLIKSLMALRKLLADRADDMARTISNEDRELLRRKKLTGTNILQQAEALSADPETAPLAERLEDFVEQLETELENRFGPAFDMVEEIEVLAARIRTPKQTDKSIDPKRQQEQLIKAYINFCKQNGVEMKYRPVVKASPR